MSPKILLPADWPRPSGYSQGVATRGTQVYVAGQVGWDRHGRFASARLSEQVRQALTNVIAVLAEAGGEPSHIVRLTWYLTAREEYQAELGEIGRVYREVMGRHFPPMSVVQVVALMESQAKVEIEATAVIPDVATG